MPLPSCAVLAAPRGRTRTVPPHATRIQAALPMAGQAVPAETTLPAGLAVTAALTMPAGPAVLMVPTAPAELAGPAARTAAVAWLDAAMQPEPVGRPAEASAKAPRTVKKPQTAKALKPAAGSGPGN